MKYDQLINKKFHILQRKKILESKDRFIYDEIGRRLCECTSGIKLNLKNSLEIGFASDEIYKYISSKFKNIDYITMDISQDILDSLDLNRKKICIDHDKWEVSNTKYDLILSNFYLNLSNNLDNLLKIINLSLNANGFFIASIPGINCFHEIKNSMIKADLEIYGGAYKRFFNNFSIENISTLLKKHNFKIPVIEMDVIELRYKKFSKLMKDIKCLGMSNIYFDRKKSFEKKNYFEKVEEIYWQNYSKDNEIILQMEVIYFSAWKKHKSQQKPLKPGEGQISLKSFLK